jgi:hypothetical protein
MTVLATGFSPLGTQPCPPGTANLSPETADSLVGHQIRAAVCWRQPAGWRE